jgi:hypothetical protein
LQEAVILAVPTYLKKKFMHILLRFLLDFVSIKRETQPFLEYNLVLAIVHWIKIYTAYKGKGF